MELTDEICEYARKYCECTIRRMRIPRITEEDIEDMVSYCLRKLVTKWSRHYNPARTQWKTYCIVILKSAVKDARKWHWRQHQRMVFEELTEHVEEGIPERADSVEGTIDDMLEGIDREVCLMRWRGDSVREIRRALGMSKGEYEGCMQRIRRALEERTGRRPPPEG